MRKLARCLVAATMLAASAALAQSEIGDAAQGRRFASQSCSNCHLVDAGQTKPAVDGVPTFISLAGNPAETPERIRGFLAKPHGAMPPISLSRQEIADVVAYIQSLKK
jgi:mono/diheme cytochrome c family protein